MGTLTIFIELNIVIKESGKKLQTNIHGSAEKVLLDGFEFFLNSPDLLLVLLALDGSIINISEKAIQLFGWKGLCSRGENFFILSEQTRIQKFVSLNDLCNLTNQKKYLYKEQTILLDGKKQIIIWSAGRYLSSSKAYYILYGKNVTTERHAETQATNTILNLESIISCMPGNVYWMDRNLKYLGCNENVAYILGLKSSSEIIGKSYDDFSILGQWTEGQGESFQNDDLEVIKTGQSKLNIEEPPILGASGNITYYLTSRVPLKDANGQVAGVAGISIDITDRKKLEIELAKMKSIAEAYLQNAVEHIPGSIYWKNLEGVYLGCNQAFADRAHLASPEEVIGKSENDMPWQDKIVEIQAVECGVIAEGQSQEIEETNIFEHDKKTVYLTKKSPLYDNEGKIIGLISASFDITERKRLEEEKLNMMMSLTASIAHEIRTPLATVNACADYIKTAMQTFTPTDHKTILQEMSVDEFEELTNTPDVIKKETLAANTFVDIMLMNINPKLGRQEIFSIRDALNEALARYPFKSKEKQRVFWDSAADFKISGSQLLIVHILFNLLKNALYYTHHHGQINIWLVQGTDKVNQLYFRDTGEGIAPAILPYIFNQFFSRTYHGTGIGLTYCKIVMESLGGEIICDSVEGNYTQFILSFPKIE